MLRYAGAATLPLLLQLIVFQRFEFFFLERFSTAADIAIYSIAFSAAVAISAPPVSIARVVTPAVATLHGADAQDRVQRGFGRAVRLLTLLTIPLVALAASLGPGAIRLVFGPGYEETRSVFLILTITLIAAPIMSISSATLFGLGKLRMPIIAAAVAALADVILSAALIPPFASIGAAIAHGLSEVVAGAIVIVAAIRLIGGIDLKSSFLARAAIAGAGGCIAASVIDRGSSSPVDLGLGFAAGAVVFGGLATILRIIPRDDAEWLTNAVGGRWIKPVDKVCWLLAERSRPSRGDG